MHVELFGEFVVLAEELNYHAAARRLNVAQSTLSKHIATLEREYGTALFVRDRKDPYKFHPRIAVQHAFVYESLYDSDKAAFNKLYDDYFYRRNNDFWYREAMKKLPRLVEATRMLVCAAVGSDSAGAPAWP